MIKEMRDFVLELVQSEYETGNQLVETRDEFEQLCADEGVRCTNAMWDLYQKYHIEGLDELAIEEFDEIIEEALSNKEKLKRAYPELNFDNLVTETLNEAVDPTDKMRTAVGILFDMDNFTLSVRDNGYWLSMGVPDGEFSENDRDLAEASYQEHIWMIEDDDGNFDAEAFRDLFDAFETATDDGDYDQNERARIIHEAEIILNMNESVSDMDKRCEKCNTLLNDMGKCPRCDEGEEDLDEAVLNEKDTRTPDEKAMAKANKRDDKFNNSLKKKAANIVAKVDISDPRSKTSKFLIVDVTTGIVKEDLTQSEFLTKYKDNENIRWNAVVVDKDGNVMRRALQVFKPGQLKARSFAKDLLKPDYKYTFEGINNIDLPKPISADASASSDKAKDTKKTKRARSKPSMKPAKSEDSALTKDSEISAPASKADHDTFADFVKSVKMLKPVISVIDGDDLKPVDIADVNKDNLGKYMIKVQNKDFFLDKFIAAAKKNGLLENIDLDKVAESIQSEELLEEGLNYKDLKELTTLAQQIGLSTVKDLNNFIDHELGDNESVLDALKRYKHDLDTDDLEELDEVFSENTIEEEFSTYNDIRNDFEKDQINYGQREAFEEMMIKAAKSLHSDPELVLIYKDSDREFDPIYFADESKELQYNVLKVKVFDLEVVRIEFKGNIYIVFRSKADADIYMNYAH